MVWDFSTFMLDEKSQRRNSIRKHKQLMILLNTKIVLSCKQSKWAKPFQKPHMIMHRCIDAFPWNTHHMWPHTCEATLLELGPSVKFQGAYTNWCRKNISENIAKWPLNFQSGRLPLILSIPSFREKEKDAVRPTLIVQKKMCDNLRKSATQGGICLTC